jgi:hypothetical protein
MTELKAGALIFLFWQFAPILEENDFYCSDPEVVFFDG